MYLYIVKCIEWPCFCCPMGTIFQEYVFLILGNLKVLLISSPLLFVM